MHVLSTSGIAITFNVFIVCTSNLSGRSICSQLILCVSARLKWSESYISRFPETKLKFKTLSKSRWRAKG